MIISTIFTSAGLLFCGAFIVEYSKGGSGFGLISFSLIALILITMLTTLVSHLDTSLEISNLKYESLIHQTKCEKLDAEAFGEIHRAENFAFCEMSDGKFIKIQNILN